MYWRLTCCVSGCWLRHRERRTKHLTLAQRGGYSWTAPSPPPPFQSLPYTSLTPFLSLHFYINLSSIYQYIIQVCVCVSMSCALSQHKWERDHVRRDRPTTLGVLYNNTLSFFHTCQPTPWLPLPPILPHAVPHLAPTLCRGDGVGVLVCGGRAVVEGRV